MGQAARKKAQRRAIKKAMKEDCKPKIEPLRKQNVAQLQPVQTIDEQLSAFDPVTWLATTAGTKYKDKMPEKDTNGAWRNPDTRIAILVRRPTKLDVNYVLVTFKANINYDDAVAAAGKMPTVIQELRMDKNTYARCVTLASRDDALKMYGKPHAVLVNDDNEPVLLEQAAQLLQKHAFNVWVQLGKPQL